MKKYGIMILILNLIQRAIMALNVSKAKLKTDFEYIPLSQKGEDKPFTVTFKAISLDVLAELQDAAVRVSKDGEYSISINTLNYNVLKEALIGWQNVESEKDGPVRFKRDNLGATDGSLSLIPGDIRSELSTVIVEVSKDLPNAEAYLSELNKLGLEDDEDEYADEGEGGILEVVSVETVEEVPTKTKAK